MNRVGVFTTNETSQFLIPKNVLYIIQPKFEQVRQKIASKVFTINKCMETAKKLSRTFYMEQQILKDYYKSLYALQRAGFKLRNFKKVADIFKPSTARGKISLDDVVAVKITPPDFLKQKHTRQDYILLSPVRLC